MRSLEVFAHLDRHSRGSVSQADMVLALRCEPEVAALLGLPSDIRQEDGSRDSFMR